MNEPQNDHWLVRPKTIRLLWVVFSVILALTVVAQLGADVKGYFAIDKLPALGAWFGFGACVAMVLAAKALGVVLKRPERYYGDADD